MTSLSPENLEPLDRKTYLLAGAYEEARQTYQRGYRLLRLDDELLETPVWKQLRTVAEWLEVRGWTLSTIYAHWQGYVRYAFRAMVPTVPMPGQLRNDALLVSYLRSAPEKPPLHLSDSELDCVYNRVIRPELRGFRRLMHLETPEA